MSIVRALLATFLTVYLIEAPWSNLTYITLGNSSKVGTSLTIWNDILASSALKHQYIWIEHTWKLAGIAKSKSSPFITQIAMSIIIAKRKTLTLTLPDEKKHQK